jgi:hypothetical protein
MHECSEVAARNALLGTIRRLIDRRLLAITVGQFHRLALAHKSNGIPIGSGVYKHLHDEARSYAVHHSETWGTDLESLHAVLPDLEHLRLLAEIPDLAKPANSQQEP